MLLVNDVRDNSVGVSNNPRELFDTDNSGVSSVLSERFGNGRESLAFSHFQTQLLWDILASVITTNPSRQETVPSDFRARVNLFPFVVPVDYFEQNRSEKERLLSKLRNSFDTKYLEDGIVHPAEQIIDDALTSANSQDVYRWLSELIADVEYTQLAASVLRCLGRCKLEPLAWRVEVVQTALASDDLELRDVAVQAAETWGDIEFCDVLKHHSEVVPWLRSYIDEVIGDLETG